MSTDVETIQDLERTWARAETEGDSDTLAALTVDDFTLVGPLGFVLNRTQWLGRYQGGGLETLTLDWDDPQIRILGDTAITIGEHVQQARFQGNPVDARFRGTHIYVRTDGGWRLAGQHLSPCPPQPEGQ
jgi:ketosteroid isomerase-like protein